MADRPDLICRRCGKSFEITADLNNHLRSEHSIYRGHIFKCRDCEYTTHRSYNLRRHLDSMHSWKDRRSVHRREDRQRSPTIAIDRQRSPTIAIDRQRSPKITNARQRPPTCEGAPQREILTVTNPVSTENLPISPQSYTSQGSPTTLRLKILRTKKNPPSSPVISLVSSPCKEFVLSPPSRPSGKPLAFLRQSLDSPSAYCSDDGEPAPVTPAVPSKILVSAVEKKTTRYYFNGHVIRHQDSTITYSARVPADWNNNVECYHALSKKD